MKATKDLTIMGVYVALLLGGQFILSGISGIEIVTVLLLSFCFVFGAKKGMLTATAFSLIRCFIFGFYPTVIILYLIYYNCFALFFGRLGSKACGKVSKKLYFITLFSAVLFTVLFTLLDDLITPLFYGFTANAFKGYFLGSLYPLLKSVICTFFSVGILFVPLFKLLNKLK